MLPGYWLKINEPVQSWASTYTMNKLHTSLLDEMDTDTRRKNDKVLVFQLVRLGLATDWTENPD